MDETVLERTQSNSKGVYHLLQQLDHHRSLEESNFLLEVKTH